MTKGTGPKSYQNDENNFPIYDGKISVLGENPLKFSPYMYD
jgi:hypothetical protein